MKKLVVLMLAMLVVGSAVAVPIDEDADMLGMYLDMEATIVCGAAAQQNLYVILTNPTFPEVAGVEFGFDVIGGPMYVLATTWPIEEVAIGGFAGSRGDWATAFAAIPTTEATVVCTMLVLPLGPSAIVLGSNEIPSDPLFPLMPTVLDQNGDVQTVGLSADVGNTAIALGTPCEDIVANEETSFDNIKSMFR